MPWQSIICFFAITITVGSFVDLLVRDWKADGLEKLFVRFGAGLAAVPVMAVVFNLLQIPLDYRVFLVVGLLILTGAILKNRQSLSARDQSLNTSIANSWREKIILVRITGPDFVCRDSADVPARGLRL